MPSKKHLFYLVSGLFLAGALSVFATSIGTNVSVSGTLSVTGNSTLAGTVALSGTTGTSTIASGQGFTIGTSQFVVQQTSGNVGIGTTSPSAFNGSTGKLTVANFGYGLVQSNGGTTIAGFWTGANASIGTISNNKFTIFVNESSVVDFETSGATEIYGKTSINGGGVTPVNGLDVGGSLAVGSYAGVNVAPANGLIVSGKVGVGTTSPSSGSNTAIDSNATTTLMLSSSTIGKGACIQLKGPGGAAFRLYATSTGPAVFESGACQ